jgi:copper homeostasis protein
MHAKLEICCFNIQAAQIAADAGADRIEFCIDKQSGGLSPSLRDVELLSKSLSVPIRVMVRCRKGNFVYTKNELDSMTNYIQMLHQFPVEGIVFGALTQENEIDANACNTIALVAQKLKITFHKAFDEVSDPHTAINILSSLGIDAVLTSGLATNAMEGKQLIQQLNDVSNSIQIMVGGGVRSNHIKTLQLETGCKWYHSSAINNNTDLPNADEIYKMKQLINS